MAGHVLTELPGGERVVSERLRGTRSVALGLWIGVGSRDETSARAGVAHFIEHLLFKGSSRYSALEIAELNDVLGGELNAATSRETTCVYTRVPDSQLERALDLMVDMVFAPALADVDSEREVVLEEIAMVEDAPQDLVHDLASEAVFGAHPLGRPVIGTSNVIAGVSRGALRSFHRRAYRGPNVVLAAAGNVEHDRLVGLVAAQRDGQRGVGEIRGEPLRGTPCTATRFVKRRTEQYHVVLAGPGLRIDDERRYAASLLDAIVGGSASSRLFQEIREKRGMAYSVYSYGSAFRETGQVAIYVGTRGDNLSECLQLTGRELRDVACGLRDGELERAKETVEGRLLLGQESTSARMNRLGRAVISGAEIVTLRETIRRVHAVSAEQVSALARDVFDPARLSVAGIGPREPVFDRAVGKLRDAA